MLYTNQPVVAVKTRVSGDVLASLWAHVGVCRTGMAQQFFNGLNFVLPSAFLIATITCIFAIYNEMGDYDA